MPHATYIIRSKGSKDNPTGTEFEFCSECNHVVGLTKKACICNGLCHPVLQEWSEYTKKARTKKPNSNKSKKTTQKKRSYYNIH